MKNKYKFKIGDKVKYVVDAHNPNIAVSFYGTVLAQFHAYNGSDEACYVVQLDEFFYSQVHGDTIKRVVYREGLLERIKSSLKTTNWIE